MSRDLQRFHNNAAVPSRGVQKVQAVTRAQVQVAAHQAEGALALAAKVMQDVVQLDELRRTLAGDDAVLSMMLTRIEMTAVSQAERIQRGLFDKWGL